MTEEDGSEGPHPIRIEDKDPGPCVSAFFPDRDPKPFDAVYLNGRRVGLSGEFEIEVDEYRISHSDQTDRTILCLRVVLE
jgi:hypothetical protein